MARACPSRTDRKRGRRVGGASRRPAGEPGKPQQYDRQDEQQDRPTTAQKPAHRQSDHREIHRVIPFRARSSRDQVGEHALERFVGGRDLEQTHIVVARDPR